MAVSEPPPNEYGTETTQRGELPDTTIQYGGELAEDITPLFDQGRLTIELNGIEVTPEYIHVKERVGRKPKKITDEVRNDTEWLNENDKLTTVTSTGFTIEFHHDQQPSPTLLCDYGMGPKCLGIHLFGVHEKWSSHHAQFSDYTLERNDDGLYEIEVETDRFIREVLK